MAELDQLKCPSCDSELDESDRARIQRAATFAQPGEVTVGNAEEWFDLSCGHRVELIVDKRFAPPGRYNVRLIYRPRFPPSP
jgi:hypothetical protein